MLHQGTESVSVEQTGVPWGGGEGSCREEGPGKEVGGRKEEREAG